MMEQENTNQKQQSTMDTLVNIFASPAQAFEAIRMRSQILVPFFIYCIPLLVLVYYYYSMVDFNWFIEHNVELQAGDKSPAEQKQMRDAMSMMSQSTTSIISAVSILIVTAIAYVLQTTYLVVVSNVSNDGYRFKHWFSFIAWTQLPRLVSTLIMFATLLMSDGNQIGFEELNPLAASQLFLAEDAAPGLKNVLNSMDFTLLWSLAVMVIGYNQMTKKGLEKSAAIILAPYIIFYGGWILIAA